MNNNAESDNIHATLRQLASAGNARCGMRSRNPVPFGHGEIDDMLRGGLGRGQLHEVFADAQDAASAAGFAALLAFRAAADEGAIIWLRQAEAQRRSGRIHAPGLVDLGLDPARLVLGLMPDPLALLRVAAEMVRCSAVATVVIELWRMPRQLDLTASRRLVLATEQSGVTTLMLRLDAEPTPSAAQTRWAVMSAAAMPLATGAPGLPTLDIHLLRQRGGRSGRHWQVEWDREQGIFRDAPLSGALVPPAERRSADAAR